MKKLVCLLLTALLFTAVCLFAFADTAVYVEEIGLSVTFPDVYDVITRDTPADDPIFSQVGLSKDTLMVTFESGNIYANGVKLSDGSEIIVIATENPIENLSSMSDAVVSVFADGIMQQFEEMEIEAEPYSIETVNGVKYIVIPFYEGVNGSHGVEYCTIIDHMIYGFALHNYRTAVTGDEEEDLFAVVNSAKYDALDAAPQETEAETQGVPFQEETQADHASVNGDAPSSIGSSMSGAGLTILIIGVAALIAVLVVVFLLVIGKKKKKAAAAAIGAVPETYPVWQQSQPLQQPVPLQQPQPMPQPVWTAAPQPEYPAEPWQTTSSTPLPQPETYAPQDAFPASAPMEPSVLPDLLTPAAPDAHLRAAISNALSGDDASAVVLSPQAQGQLRMLQKLLLDGTITQEEYDRRRRDLIGM